MRSACLIIARLLPTIVLGFGSPDGSAHAPPLAGTCEPVENLEAEILLGAARNAVHRGDLDTAIERFSQFLVENPTRDDARREYAGVLFRAGRVREALPEYELLLSRHPRDAELRESFIDVLLTVGDHPRAKAQLREALRMFPDRLDFAVTLALLHALDGEISEAESLARTVIEGRPLTSDRMKLEAAALYVQLRRRDRAGPLLAELLETMPDNAEVLALSVRYALMIGDYASAVRQAARLDRLHPGDVGLRLELASAIYASGEYAEAGRLFRDVLQIEPASQVALLGAARVALRDYQVELADAFLDRVPDGVRERQWLLAMVERDTIAGNYLRARVILDRLLVENYGDKPAAMAMADLDRAENEFIKADCRYRANGAMRGDSVATEQLAVSLYLQHRLCDSERACREALALDPRNARAMILLTRILVRTHRCGEAVELVRLAGEIERRPSPEGIYFARFVSADFACGFEQPGRTEREPADDDQRRVYLAVTWFDLAMEDGRRDWARAVLGEALAVYPNNVVLRTRLAEWHASFGTPCAAGEAAAIYEGLLRVEPSNQKWILGLARALATRRDYCRSLALYRRLRDEMPDNYLVARETARVLFDARGTMAALDEYDAALAHWRGVEEEARRLELERSAKCMQYCIPSGAAGVYRELARLEPYELHLAFELGQVYGNLGTTRRAIDTYTRLLSVAPNHRDARIALEGKCLDLRPKLTTDHQFVRERGRDGLTSIDRLGNFVGYHMPLADQNEFIELGYGRLNLAPTFGGATDGDALVVRMRKQVGGDFGAWLSPEAPMALFLDCEVQRYDRFVSTRPVFETGVILRTFDDMVWTVAGTMENVLENGESLRQDIYRGGLRLNLAYMPNNYWESDATGEFQGYSDDNLRYAVELRNRLQLTPDPRRVSLLADFYYWTFAEPSQFSPGPDPYAGMKHPYWAPIDFAMSGVGIEWKQWLSRDRFDGADQWWVAFSAMKRWDSENKNYTIYQGTMAWDITRRLSGYAIAEYNYGSPYHAARAYGGLSWTF